METSSNTLLTFKLGGEREINRIGYGSMQLTGKGVWGDPDNRENAKIILNEVISAGVNFIDTADSYGPNTVELLIKEAIAPFLSQIVLATKGGFERPAPGEWVVNGQPGYIKKCINGSLDRLGVNQIDLWQLHRVDPNVPIEDTLGPVAEAVAEGKIKYVGLSEVSIENIERAEKIVPIVSVQNHYNLSNRVWEEVLDYTAQKNIAFIPWFPLASGPGKMQDKLGHIALTHNVTVAEVALAWLLKRSANILLIPGTSSVQHLNQNLMASSLILSDEEFDIISKA